MNSRLYRYLRRKLGALVPGSPLGKLTLYVALLRAGVYVLQGLRRAVSGPQAAEVFAGWAAAFNVILAVQLVILFLRWLRQSLMWRLRNRLIVTYIFIGVIPVALVVTMALFAGYLFVNQYVTSQARLAIDSDLRSLSVVNALITGDLAERLTASATPTRFRDLKRLEQQFPGLQVTVFRNGKPTTLFGSAGDSPIPPRWLKPPFQGIVVDNGQFYLRTVEAANAGKLDVIVLFSVPISKAVLDRSMEGIGEVGLYPLVELNGPTTDTLRLRVNKSSPNDSTNQNNDSVQAQNTVSVTGGRAPQMRVSWRWDPEFSFGTIAPHTEWTTGEPYATAMSITTRASALYDRLFAHTGQFAQQILDALVAVAIIFGLIELFALFVGVGLTRTITRSVFNLYEATKSINRGNLKHRIIVRNEDQLAALETSFNSMSESLENLIEEQKEKERLESELTIAQEVQAMLFPRHSVDLETLELHGICKPAQRVSGDYYDFIPCGEEQLGLALGDISGKGISAALLMATVHSAVRAYEFGKMPQRDAIARLEAVAVGGTSCFTSEPKRRAANSLHSPGEVMRMLNRHLFFSTPPEKYATLFLGVYHGGVRTLTYCNAGHLPPVIIGADGSVRGTETGGMVIGLFDGIEYKDSSVQLNPGDIFVAFSDGLTEPENDFGEFGEARLIEIVRSNRGHSLARISDLVTSGVRDWIGSGEQPDDMTLVLARAR